ncbi:MAG: flagellar assembly protein FliW, partial [Candidatus Jordarchaeaceae archaeon]
ADLPEISFIVLDGKDIEVLKNIYISEEDQKILNITNLSEIALYVILRFDKKNKKLYANIKAPIAINIKDKNGLQIVLDSEELSTDYPLMGEG